MYIYIYIKYTEYDAVYVIDKVSNADIVKRLFVAKRFEVKC